jgi:hypothetical protein
MKRVLFVDDEPNIPEGLKRMLDPLRNEWTPYSLPMAATPCNYSPNRITTCL